MTASSTLQLDDRALVQPAATQPWPGISSRRGAEARWFVLHTRYNQEKKVAEQLAARGVEHFLPLTQHTRRYGRRRMQVELPLFSGYIFLLGSPQDAYEQDRTRRLVQIIEVRDQLRLEWELSNIRMALECGVDLSPYRHLHEGVRVRVTEGPFEGLEGVIEDCTRPDRLILQVEMLGRSVAVELHGAALETLE